MGGLEEVSRNGGGNLVAAGTGPRTTVQGTDNLSPAQEGSIEPSQGIDVC